MVFSFAFIFIERKKFNQKADTRYVLNIWAQKHIKSIPLIFQQFSDALLLLVYVDWGELNIDIFPDRLHKQAQANNEKFDFFLFILI